MTPSGLLFDTLTVTDTGAAAPSGSGTTVWNNYSVSIQSRSVVSTVPTSPQTIAQPSRPPLTNANWPQVQQDLGAYLGRTVALDGQVEQTDIPNSPAGAFSVSLDPANDIGASRIIILPPSSGPAVAQNDILRITGTIGTPADMQSLFGADFTVAVVTASALQPETYGQAFSPAIETIAASPAQSQNGMTVTVTKVVVAADQTRVWLTAVNDTGTKAHLWAVDAALVQARKQVQINDSLLNNEGYPTIPDPMLNATTTSAVLIFGSVKPNGGTVTFDLPAASEDFSQTWNDFIFTFTP